VELDASDVISDNQELVVCVGMPASGKSTFSRTVFEANGYIRVNQVFNTSLNDLRKGHIKKQGSLHSSL
jgi:predicted kinase